MVMLLHDLFLHKAMSREVIIRLFTPMPNARAHSTYLEIKCHILSSAGAGNLTGKVNYLYMANSQATIILKRIRGCKALIKLKLI